MARPKPPEELFPATYRLTRTQIRKVQSMGGVAWLREMISKAQASRACRTPIDNTRTIRARNDHIAESGLPSAELAAKYKLSIKRVQQIRKQYAQ